MNKLLVACAIAGLIGGPALASGGSPARTPSRSAAPEERLSPEQEAALKYNDGLKSQEKADALLKQAGSEMADAKTHDKLVTRAKKEYERALREYEMATEKSPSLFQAWSGMGYAHRKLGDYDAALAAYNKAIELEPRYSPAIEYRAEAYLGLNRIDDAKSAYTALFSGDRKRADELHAAMKQWLELRRKDPAGVAPETIEEFSKWVAQREEIAGHTSSLLQPKVDRW